MLFPGGVSAVGENPTYGRGDGAGSSTSALWSHNCRWTDLLVPVSVEAGRHDLDVRDGWTRRWTASWRAGETPVVSPVRALADAPVSGRTPVRRFTWRREQRHRPGLEFLSSTGRRHGFESLEEDWLLRVMDFAGGVVELLPQPLEITFRTRSSGRRRHTPDFFAVTRAGSWLIDVRPAKLIDAGARESFAAAAEVALVAGWHYVVVAGWRPHVLSGLDAMYARRGSSGDPLGLRPVLLARAAAGVTFGELAYGCEYWPVARAQLLHLLWHRRLGVDLAVPLTDDSLIVRAGGEG
ncbi:hypothetical protein GCM10017562_41070 [Streptomyces roseofulvus]